MPIALTETEIRGWADTFEKKEKIFEKKWVESYFTIWRFMCVSRKIIFPVACENYWQSSGYIIIENIFAKTSHFKID